MWGRRERDRREMQKTNLYLPGKDVARIGIGAMLFRTGIWVGISFMIREKEETVEMNTR